MYIYGGLFLPCMVTSASQLSGTCSIFILKGIYLVVKKPLCFARTWALHPGSLTVTSSNVEVDSALCWPLAVSTVEQPELTPAIRTRALQSQIQPLSKVAVPHPILLGGKTRDATLVSICMCCGVLSFPTRAGRPLPLVSSTPHASSLPASFKLLLDS